MAKQPPISISDSRAASGWSLPLGATPVLVLLLGIGGGWEKASGADLLPQRTDEREALASAHLPATVLTSSLTQQRMTQARQLLAAGRVPAALPLLQAILEEPHDSFVRGVAPFGPQKGANQKETTSVRWSSARGESLRLLRDSGPEVLAQHRLNYESRAALRLREALATGDRWAVADLGRRYPLTVAGRQAFQWLFAWHLDRGHWRAADAFSRLLATLPPAANLPVAERTTAVSPAARDHAEALLRQVQATLAHAWAIPPLSGWPSSARGDDNPLLAQQSALAEQLQQLATQFPRQFPPAALIPGERPLAQPDWQSRQPGNPQVIAGLKAFAAQQGTARRGSYPGFFPAVVGSTVVARSWQGMRALDRATGTILWEKNEPLLQASSSPLLTPIAQERLARHSILGAVTTDGQSVFAVEGDWLPEKKHATTLVALSLADGSERWRFRGLPQSVEEQRKASPLAHAALEHADAGQTVSLLGPPLVIDGDLYLVALMPMDELKLLCLDAATGKLAWLQPIGMLTNEEKTEVRLYAEAARLGYGEGVLVIPARFTHYVAFAPASGQLLWEESVEPVAQWNLWTLQSRVPPRQRPPLSPPFVVDGRVVMQAPYNRGVLCRAVHTGQPLWQVRREEDTSLAGVFGGQIILAGSERVRSLALADGASQWLAALPPKTVPVGEGAFVKEAYIVPLSDGTFFTVELATGSRQPATAAGAEGPEGNLLAVGTDLLAAGFGALRHYSAATKANR